MDDMSETTKRRAHTPEFKAKVGLKALGGTKTVNELAQEFGVSPSLIHLWRKDIQDHAKTLFEGKRGPKAAAGGGLDEDVTERLYGQIGRLKVELDWLKKKSGISLP
jgi:transposase